MKHQNTCKSFVQSRIGFFIEIFAAREYDLDRGIGYVEVHASTVLCYCSLRLLVQANERVC
jgi:hypothetical protein